MLPAAPDVLVIGGGVIGCAVAHAVAGRGQSVLLVERGALGSEASSAAAGVLAVASGDDEGERLALRRASLVRMAPLAQALLDDTGIDVQLALDGTLTVALDDEDVAALEERLARRRAQGFDVAWLDAVAARAEAPLLTPVARGGLACAGEGRVDPVRLVEALARGARARGATIVPGAEARALDVAGDRIAHVDVLQERVTPGIVVLAAGAWSARLVGDVDVAPVRGQMLALRAPRGELPRRVVSSADAYLVPHPGGDLLVGATLEDAGFDGSVTPAGLARLVAHVERLAPRARDWPLVRTWAGLRPAARRRGPSIGRHPRLANCLVATGHHRNGILLAPITADAVAALVDGTPPPPEVVPFAPLPA